MYIAEPMLNLIQTSFGKFEPESNLKVAEPEPCDIAF